MSADSAFARLTAMGFILAGEWYLVNDQLTAKLVSYGDMRNILYAFIVDRAVMYVGKTVLPLRSRLQGYRTPGPTQSTNIRNNKNLRQALESGKQIEIYALPDNGLLYYGGFHVNLAAGLEDSVVRDLRPPWNGGKKETGEAPVQ
jgi:hypothetical protein